MKWSCGCGESGDGGYHGCRLTDRYVFDFTGPDFDHQKMAIAAGQRAALTSLGRNLALAAFGARCFELGVEHERNLLLYHGSRNNEEWWPGCGRPAP